MAGPDLIAAPAADRLAEAAQVLLDAARAANAENPDFEPGREYVGEPYALAVQALFMADVWDRPGAKVKLDPARTTERIRGLSYGLGVAMAILPAGAQLPCALAMQSGLNQGMAQGRAAKQAERS